MIAAVGDLKVRMTAADAMLERAGEYVDRAGADPTEAERGQTFGTMEMAVGAAMGGVGVAIADVNLVHEELASGRLAAPFPLILRDGSGYLLITERGRFGEPKIAAFRDWLLAEIEPRRRP